MWLLLLLFPIILIWNNYKKLERIEKRLIELEAIDIDDELLDSKNLATEKDNSESKNIKSLKTYEEDIDMFNTLKLYEDMPFQKLYDKAIKEDFQICIRYINEWKFNYTDKYYSNIIGIGLRITDNILMVEEIINVGEIGIQ